MDPFLQAAAEPSGLPEALQDLHSKEGTYIGRCDIQRGQGWLAGLALWLGRFPHSGRDVPVRVTVSRCGPGWEWRRDFGGHITQSRLSFDQQSNCVREDFGALSIWLKPVVAGARLQINIRRLTLWGIAVPNALLPQSSTVEWQDDQSRFRFDVSARAPLVGQLIRYHGWLTPDHSHLPVV